MIRRPTVVATRAASALRGLWPDRNPLRWTIDRIEAVVVGGLVVAFLAGAPLAAVADGHAAYGSAACPSARRVHTPEQTHLRHPLPPYAIRFRADNAEQAAVVDRVFE